MFSDLNQTLFYKKDDLVNNRPQYSSRNDLYAIWFDSTSWIIGDWSNIFFNNVDSVYYVNNNYDDCPTDSELWQDNLQVKCYGK